MKEATAIAAFIVLLIFSIYFFYINKTSAGISLLIASMIAGLGIANYDLVSSFKWGDAEIIIDRSIPVKTETGDQAGSTQKEDPRIAYQNGIPVLKADKIYELDENKITIDQFNVLETPNYKEDFKFNGKVIRLHRIKESIGLLVTNGRVEGPVIRGVEIELIE